MCTSPTNNTTYIISQDPYDSAESRAPRSDDSDNSMPVVEESDVFIRDGKPVAMPCAAPPIPTTVPTISNLPSIWTMDRGSLGGGGRVAPAPALIPWLYEVPVDVNPSSHVDPEREHPVDGVIRPHEGVDLPAPIGTPVVAPMDGEVIAVKPNNGGAGNTVDIRDDHGRVHRFFHLSEMHVEVGQRVSQGETIAEVGNTGGKNTGPHLHWEVREADGTLLDPWTDIPGVGDMSRENMLEILKNAGQMGEKVEGELPVFED